MKLTIDMPDEVLEPLIQTSLNTGNSVQKLIESSLVLMRAWNDTCKEEDRVIVFIKRGDISRAKQYNNIKLVDEI